MGAAILIMGKTKHLMFWTNQIKSGHVGYIYPITGNAFDCWTPGCLVTWVHFTAALLFCDWLSSLAFGYIRTCLTVYLPGHFSPRRTDISALKFVQRQQDAKRCTRVRVFTKTCRGNFIVGKTLYFGDLYYCKGNKFSVWGVSD